MSMLEEVVDVALEQLASEGQNDLSPFAKFARPIVSGLSLELMLPRGGR